MKEVWIIILAGILGGAVRCVLGYLAESETDEPFRWEKAGKSLLRATLGGAVLAYFLSLEPQGTFFAAFLADVGSKNVWDIIRKKREEGL